MQHPLMVGLDGGGDRRAVDEIRASRRKVTRLESDVDMLTRADMDRAA